MRRTIIEVVNPGILSTVQDQGRYEGLSIGIPQSGAMDQYAFRMANLLVDNAVETPVIETTFGNVEYLFHESAVVAVTGAGVAIKINDCDVKMWESYRVKRGDHLKLGSCTMGCRNYIAIKGAWQMGEAIYGSHATYLRGKIGGLNGRALKKGDEIAVVWDENCKKRRLKSRASNYFDMLKISQKTVRITMGPQEQAFSDQGIEHFLNTGYKVLAQSDRMGIRLNGRQIGHVLPADIISDGIAFGAIQVPSDGQPIVMMADRQTTGGYTKIGTVISADLPILAQAVRDDVIYFKRVEENEMDRYKSRQYSDMILVGETVLDTRYYEVDVNQKNFHVMVEVLETS